VGIVMVYRIDPLLARQQAQWMVLGLVLFATTILVLRRQGVGVLERYRYTIAVVGIGMTVLPRLPVIPGNGVAGVAVAVGPGVGNDVIGGRLVSTTGGTGGYAQLVGGAGRRGHPGSQRGRAGGRSGAAG